MPQFLAILSVIIITGSLFYYLYALTTPVIVLLALITLVLIIKWRRHFRFSLPQFSWLYIPFIIVLISAFYVLFEHQTTDALRSPWEVVPPFFFLLYGVAILIFIGRSAGSPPPTIAEVSMEESASADGGKLRLSTLSKNAEGSLVEHAELPRHRSVSPERETAERHQLLAISILTFLALSISLIIFPLGSGFDPFVHQATEKIIAATGTITPKPLYYIGQYTLVVFFSKILGISVAWIDKLLIPLLASLLLPWSIMNWAKNSKADIWSFVSKSLAAGRAGTVPPKAESEAERERNSLAGGIDSVFSYANARWPLSIISFLLLPFLLTPFTTTTPYSLALLFLVVLIFLQNRPAVAVLLALAALLIHSLVGIPAFIFVFLKIIKTKKRLLLTAYCLLASLAIPLAFLISSQLSSQIHITFAPQNFLPWLQSLSWGGIYRENRFNAPLDLLYFYSFNIKNIFWFFILTTFILQIKKWWQRRAGAAARSGDASRATQGRDQTSFAKGEQTPTWGGLLRVPLLGVERGAPAGGGLKNYCITFLILLTSYILMSGFLSFNFLIGYEQADYARRVLDIAQLFLIPFFLLGIHWWFSRISLSASWRIVAIIILTLGITASLFLTYPQKVDRYSVSHAFNTSQADIDAVRWIDADAHGEDYIVLANQAVSAAAIRELGFKKYYQQQPITYNLKPSTSIFFYPIPTGSPLYKFYLDMVYQKASAETLREAIQLVGAKRGYFVLNRYWNDFDRIVAEAQQNLRPLHSINNSVFIFTIR